MAIISTNLKIIHIVSRILTSITWHLKKKLAIIVNAPAIAAVLIFYFSSVDDAIATMWKNWYGRLSLVSLGRLDEAPIAERPSGGGTPGRI